MPGRLREIESDGEQRAYTAQGSFCSGAGFCIGFAGFRPCVRLMISILITQENSPGSINSAMEKTKIIHQRLREQSKDLVACKRRCLSQTLRARFSQKRIYSPFLLSFDAIAAIDYNFVVSLNSSTKVCSIRNIRLNFNPDCVPC